MDYLLNTANDIFTVTLNTASKSIILSGANDYPLDQASPQEIYDVTAGGYIGLPNRNEFAFFRSNGLPIFVWGLSSLPVGAANGDTINFTLSIPQNQSLLTQVQKQASASAGSPGTLVAGETPTGTINGTNKTFTLANTPITGAVVLIYTPANQPTQFLLYGVDFTMVGSVATLVVVPITGSSLFANYYH